MSSGGGSGGRWSREVQTNNNAKTRMSGARRGEGGGAKSWSPLPLGFGSLGV